MASRQEAFLLAVVLAIEVFAGVATFSDVTLFAGVVTFAPAHLVSLSPASRHCSAYAGAANRLAAATIAERRILAHVRDGKSLTSAAVHRRDRLGLDGHAYRGHRRDCDHVCGVDHYYSRGDHPRTLKERRRSASARQSSQFSIGDCSTQFSYGYLTIPNSAQFQLVGLLQPETAPFVDGPGPSL